MKVVITYTLAAAAELNLILDRLPGNDDDDRDLLVESYLADLTKRLRQSHGHLPDALKDEMHQPPVYRIRTFDDVWVEYTVEDVRGWFWSRRRTVTITSFREIPSEGAASRR